MPLYDYRCACCGPFEVHRSATEGGGSAACPGCDAPGTRVFVAPGGREPRRLRRLHGLGSAARAQVDRSEGGAPATGGLPRGLRWAGAGTPPGLGADETSRRRPWQVGH